MVNKISQRSKRGRLRYDRAQFAVIDIVLFATIILLVISVQVVYSDDLRYDSDLTGHYMIKSQAADVLNVLLRTTLDARDYVQYNRNKSTIVSGPEFRPVFELLTESLYTKSMITTERFSNNDKLDAKVKDILTRLVWHTYGFIFSAGLDNTTITLNSSGSQEQLNSRMDISCAEHSSDQMINGASLSVEFKLCLWRI